MHKTDDLRLPWSNGLELQEELIKLPVCLCQLQGVNFIRGKGPNHICTCILAAASEPRFASKAKQKPLGAAVGLIIIWK